MSVVSITILVDGNAISENAILKSLDVIHEVNKIGYGQLEFVDGNSAIGKFNLSQDEGLVPGAEVEIKLRYEGDPDSEDSVFQGIIVRHTLEADGNSSGLTIELKNKAVKMTSLRKKQIFSDVSDTDVFSQLIEDNELDAGELAETQTNYPELVQYWSTDWDMLLTRADLHGFWVKTDNGEISVLNPSEIETSTADYKYEYGIDTMFGFTVEANAESQVGNVLSNGWSIPDQALSASNGTDDYNPDLSDFKPSDFASAMGTDDVTLHSTIPLDDEELTSWANGRLRKTRAGMIRGRISIPGNAKIKIGDVVEIGGLNVHFSGNVAVTGVRHRMNMLGWITDIQFGVDPKPFASSNNINQSLAGGILPAVSGLQIGIVDSFEEDPMGELRVKVKVPSLGEDNNAIWARLLTPDGGNERGIFFRPETGDEVILGFLNNDPRHAIILGSMYSSAISPPVENSKIDENNYLKGIFTKTGMKVSFDDENQTIELTTSDKQSITINEKDKKIELKDCNNNVLLLDDSGIKISTDGDFTLESKGKVVLKGTEIDMQ